MPFNSSAEAKMAQASSGAQPTRRWLQFRLRSLLLIPFLLLLLQVLSDQLFDHLLWLWSGYGSFFGTLWAIGRMQRVGLRYTGLPRCWAIVRAAIGGGIVGGTLIGPVALWTGLFRGDSCWFFDTPGVRLRAWEIFTSGVAGYWCGGLVGALAGGVFGTTAAYSVYFWGRFCETAACIPESTHEEDAKSPVAAHSRQRRSWLWSALAASLVISPPIWIGACLVRDQAEQRAIERLQQHGQVQLAIKRYGPLWFSVRIEPYYDMYWFHHVTYMSFAGPVDANTVTDLNYVGSLRDAHFELHRDDDLFAIAAWLKGRPDLQADLSLSGPDITDKGASSLRQLNNIYGFHVFNTSLSHASIAMFKHIKGTKKRRPGRARGGPRRKALPARRASL
ncbi:MAG TPA: hypothetical protein VN699_03845 [Pirellulales bacterium]|nr:hypothetical protein [Pirellulales bacterium]